MRNAIAGEKIAGGLEIMAALAAASAFLLGFGLLLLDLLEWIKFGTWSQLSILSFLVDDLKIIPGPRASCAGLDYGTPAGSSWH